MKLLVFGAGGRIGGRIVTEALERGHDVTSVHRRALPDAPQKGRAVQGDVREPLPLLKSVLPEAVVCAVGAAPMSATPDFSVYLDAARAVVSASRALGDGAPRVLAVGGAGSLQVGAGVNLVDTPEFPAQFREEALAQAKALDFYRTVSDVRWTYVSPAASIEPGTRTGRYRRGGDDLLLDDDGRSFISIEDYAVAVVDELESARSLGRRMTVAY